jgi:hypothetical protein
MEFVAMSKRFLENGEDRCRIVIGRNAVDGQCFAFSAFDVKVK